MIRNTTKNQKLCWLIFILYLVGLTYFMFFAENLGRGGQDEEAVSRGYNLVPFLEIKRFIIYRDILGIKAVILNIFGNIIAFIPCGFLLPVISRRCKLMANSILVGFFISLLIEMTQFVFSVGSFDVDDMILNTLGAAIGAVMYTLVQRYRIKRKKRYL